MAGVPGHEEEHDSHHHHEDVEGGVDRDGHDYCFTVLTVTTVIIL